MNWRSYLEDWYDRISSFYQITPKIVWSKTANLPRASHRILITKSKFNKRAEGSIYLKEVKIVSSQFYWLPTTLILKTDKPIYFIYKYCFNTVLNLEKDSATVFLAILITHCEARKKLIRPCASCLSPCYWSIRVPYILQAIKWLKNCLNHW